MFHSILLPIDGSEYSASSTRYAIQAAKRFDARVRALYVIDIKRLAAPLLNDVALCLGISSVPNLEETYRTTLTQIGNTVLESCLRKCRSAGVECETLLQTGIVSDVICQEAHKVDLVIMGHRGENSQWGSRLFGSVFEATIRQINRPVFVVSKFRQTINRVLAAYDGSNHSSNALKVAVDFCAHEDLPLHVLVVSEAHDDEKPLQEEVESFLTPYKVDWHLERGAGDPCEVITAKARELNADVIAMGAYGHSRIKELLVGSTTDYVIRNASCPVLVYR